MLAQIIVTHNRTTFEYTISLHTTNGRTIVLTMDGKYGTDAENLLDFLKMQNAPEYVIYGNNNSGFVIDCGGMLMADGRKVVIL